MLQLRYQTPSRWAELVLDNLDTFLQDHAANERKVSGSALTLAVQHPHKERLVSTLIDIAREELDHFAQIHDVLRARGQHLAYDAPDPYMTALRRRVRKADVESYLLDRLILFAIVEARGCERFSLLERALQPGPLKTLYSDLVRSEARHHAVYLDLAREYFDRERVSTRLDELLDIEADAIRDLPLRPALH